MNEVIIKIVGNKVMNIFIHGIDLADICKGFEYSENVNEEPILLLKLSGKVTFEYEVEK